MSKVFVIDDSVSACVAIERMLGSQGFDVVWEKDAVTALSTVEKHVPDLVICDLMLPDISGFEVCQSLRANPLLPEVPVLLISGDVDADVRRRAGVCDAAGVLAKPFSPAQLVEQVQEILGAVEPLPEEEPMANPPLGLRQRITTELAVFSGLDCRFAGVLDGGNRVVAVHGRANPESLPRDLSRQLSCLGELANKAASDLSVEAEAMRLTLEVDGGVSLVDRVGADHLLAVVLRDRRSLGLARYLMRKARQPLATSLTPETLETSAA